MKRFLTILVMLGVCGSSYPVSFEEFMLKDPRLVRMENHQSTIDFLDSDAEPNIKSETEPKKKTPKTTQSSFNSVAIATSLFFSGIAGFFGMSFPGTNNRSRTAQNLSIVPYRGTNRIISKQTTDAEALKAMKRPAINKRLFGMCALLMTSFLLGSFLKKQVCKLTH